MARHQARALAAIATALFAGVATPAGAQYSRGANPNAPKLMIGTLKDSDKKTGMDAAEALRDRISGDVSIRELYVFPRSDIKNTLEQSGYQEAEALTPSDAVQLAKMIRADEYFEGVVQKTATGYTIEASIVLARDASLVQPLGSFSGPKLDNVAAQVSKAYQKAHAVFDNEKRCRLAVRESKWAEVSKEVAEGIKNFPTSTWMRYCQLQALTSQKKGAAEVLPVVEDILKIDAKSKPALAEAVSQYEAAGQTDKKIDALMKLYQADPSNARLQITVVNELAAAKKFDLAKPMIEKSVAENPGDVGLAKLYWLILGATDDLKKFVKVGEEMVQMDTSLADADYFDRMISAYSADSNSAKAAATAAKATAKFPKRDDFWAKRGQFELKGGQTAQAIASLKRALEINPKTPGARLIILKSYHDAGQWDTLYTAMHDAIKAGEDAGTVGQFAVSASSKLLSVAQKADPKTIADFEKVLTWVAYADSTLTDKSMKNSGKFVSGVAYFFLGTLHYGDLTKSKQCSDAKAAQEAFTNAQINLPAGGATNADVIKQLLGNLAQYAPAADQAVKGLCK
jgi:tetratricopeptide (TPR) repeat protein